MKYILNYYIIVVNVNYNFLFDLDQIKQFLSLMTLTIFTQYELNLYTESF